MHRDTLLITGANGHVGSLLMQGLQWPGPILGIDRKSGTDSRVLVADMAEIASLPLDGRRVALAIHLAADPDEAHSLSELVQPNILGNECVLRWCAEQGVPRIVYASSCEAFMGTAGELPLDAAYAPRNVYGCTKVFGEMLCRMLHQTHGCHSLALRLGAMLPAEMHEQLSGDPGYESIRVPEAEFLQVMQRVIQYPWQGSHEVFLGPLDSTRLPTRDSLARFFGEG